jgi:uncharacterized membrane protein
MSQAGYRSTSATTIGFRAFVAIAVATIALAFLLGCVTPARADAKSYSMGPVDILASVQTDGTLTVAEQRTFDFDGDFTAIWWNLPTEKTGGIQVSGVSLTGADGQTQQLPEVPFQTRWRTAGGPGTTAYSVDSNSDSVDPYVFFNITDEKVVVTLEYQVINAIDTWSDIGELYWKFVAPDWAEASRDVQLTVTLPKPASMILAEGDVRAWGHGDLAGTVDPGDDGTVIYQVGTVKPDTFAEARIAFPVAWMTEMPIENNTPRLDNIIAEETAWADKANQQRTVARIALGAVIAISLLLIAVALLLFFRFGKEYKPQFQDKYWRDYPSDDPPAVLGALWKWGNIDTAEFTATLMSLSERGIVGIDKGSYADQRGKTVEDYVLTLNPAKASELKNPIDVAAIDLVFNKVAEGRNALYFKSIELYGKKNPTAFMEALNDWKAKVKTAADSRGYFEMTGNLLMGAMMVAAFIWIALAAFFAFGTGEIIMGGIAAAAGVIVVIIAAQMRRRSKAAVELHARCAALRNWLVDFSNLKESIPTDVKVWGRFMIFAVVFGVADQVIKQLKLTVPEVVEDPGFMPVYLWMLPTHSGGTTPLASMAQTFNSTFQAATTTNSSGGGFGGGFSGGGGGGFGGGGGGAR